MTAMPTMAENASPASVVAEVILGCNRWENQLVAGDDVKTLVANRQQYDDATLAVLNHNLDFKLFDI
jgi:hypothetical protein